MKTARNRLGLFKWLCLASSIGIISWAGVTRWHWVPVLNLGTSMLPTFESGDLVWMRKNHSATPERFDIALIQTKLGLMTKRVIGLPGERVAMEEGVLFVNGKKLQEPYAVLKGAWNLHEGRLRSNSYLLIGDNRELDERIVFIVEPSDILATIPIAYPRPPQNRLRQFD
jgi:signal peptidase I